jgi:hypothetical protein
MSRSSKLLGILVGGLLVSACATFGTQDPTEFDTAPLLGMVYDTVNQPVAGAQVAVHEGPEAVTDIGGRFVLPGLSRGEHRVFVRKAGYETTEVSVAFLNRTQVLYVKLVSFDALLQRAERGLSRRKWAEAEKYLDRAAAIDPEDPLLRFTRAVLAYRREEFRDAVSLLRGLLDDGYREPAVYLFAADTYQYKLNRPEEAQEMLRRYLEQVQDPEARTRLDALESVDGAD